MRSNSAKQGDQASWGLKLAAWGGLVFLHFPIAIIFLYAFNTEEAAFSFPPQGFTLRWFSVAFACCWCWTMTARSPVSLPRPTSWERSR